jgi:endonuclease YncB( thermonuclease family)
MNWVRRATIVLTFWVGGCSAPASRPSESPARFYDAAAAPTTAPAGRTYDAVVVRVIDGDTFIADVSIPVDTDFVKFTIVEQDSIRLLGINAPELRTPAGPAARDALATLDPVGTHVILSRVKPDKYSGRFDCEVTNAAGVDCNAWMVAHSFAVPYNP